MTQREYLHEEIKKRWASGELFSYSDVCQLIQPGMAKVWPRGKTLERTISRLLQELRDTRFLEFVDNQGTYRRP